MSKNMVLTWGPDCDFIFLEYISNYFRWKVTDWPMLWVGVALTFITCFLTTAYGPIIRKQIKIQSKTKLGTTMGYFFEYLLKLYVMLLMMTMNAYVCLAIALGISLGYSVFSNWGDKIRHKIFRKSL